MNRLLSLVAILLCAACSTQATQLQKLSPPPKMIIITTGSLTQPYTILGEVQVDSRGIINWNNAFAEGLGNASYGKLGYALSKIGSEPATNVDQEELYSLVRKQAYASYADRVDAVINLSRVVTSSGTVTASGIAIQFTDSAS